MMVPHRANRAVIFDADLFHETDLIAFQSGYTNRRLNINYSKAGEGRRRGKGESGLQTRSNAASQHKGIHPPKEGGGMSKDA
jgi:hypothetical protein